MTGHKIVMRRCLRQQRQHLRRHGHKTKLVLSLERRTRRGLCLGAMVVAAGMENHGHALAMHFGDKVAGVTRVMRHTSEGVERR